MLWLFHYYFGACDDDWYLSLFKGGTGKLKGEITPAYSILDVEDVARVRRLCPEAKIILILRNPIDRAWSQVCFEWTKGTFEDVDDLEKIKAFIERPFQSLRGNYPRTIRIWTSCFPEEQIFIGFFDDLVRNTQHFMSSVVEFLGGKAEKLNLRTLHRKQNVSKKMDPPREIKYYLAKKYHTDIKTLNAMLGGYCATWLEQTEKILTAAK